MRKNVLFYTKEQNQSISHVIVREKEEAQSSLANHYQMNKRKSIIFMESIREKEEGGWDMISESEKNNQEKREREVKTAEVNHPIRFG
jgi:hypothetical protein